MFAALVALLVLAAAGYVGWARARTTAAPPDANTAIRSDTPALLFQNLADDAGYGRLAVMPLDEGDVTRHTSDLSCDRVHFAARRGLCLANWNGFSPRPKIKLFGPDFRVRSELPLDGLPSRTRVSPDGRYGAATAFVTGHSYAQNNFSTSTILLDMTRGTRLANLEEFTVIRDGERYESEDVNFWGVTFADDSNRFYATLSTRGQTYLVEGDIAERRLVAKRENVECPSLSPDGTRIGFKKRMNPRGEAPIWRFHVLDLATGKETPLAEARSIDDQLEWLDNDTLLYGSGDSTHTIMAVAADGTGQPRRLLSQAASPTALRASLPGAVSSSMSAGPSVEAANVGVTVDPPTDTPAGQPMVYTLTVTNKGPGEATSVVADALVSGARVTDISTSPPTDDGGYGCGVMPEEGRASCDTPQLPAGVSWTITVTVIAPDPAVVEVQGLVAAAEPDPSNANDIGSASAKST